MIKLKRERPIIMGILNVTPDSFSDGGKFQDAERAVSHAMQMIEEGADIIDIGGESTRPGSKRIDANEQKKRVLHIIAAIKNNIPSNVSISIDTTLAEVAAAALDAGADIVNDISAGRDDPLMLSLIADRHCQYIMMHMQGTPGNMQDNPQYENCVDEIYKFLLERTNTATAAGIEQNTIIIDPGIGFGRTSDHNLELMAGLDRFVDSGYPVLLGTSRKRFMGTLCEITSSEQLVGATCATTVLGVIAGIKIFRVHDVRENRQAADMAWQILQRYSG
jgi:dihydropteroate synthase